MFLPGPCSCLLGGTRHIVGSVTQPWSRCPSFPICYLLLVLGPNGRAEQILVRPLGVLLTGKVIVLPIEIQNSNKQITIIWESIQILSTPMVTHINAFSETLNLLRKFCRDRVLSIDTTCQLNYSVRPEDLRGQRETDMLLEDP